MTVTRPEIPATTGRRLEKLAVIHVDMQVVLDGVDMTFSIVLAVLWLHHGVIRNQLTF